jgi:hypothetical protein
VHRPAGVPHYRQGESSINGLRQAPAQRAFLDRGSSPTNQCHAALTREYQRDSPSRRPDRPSADALESHHREERFTPTKSRAQEVDKCPSISAIMR